MMLASSRKYKHLLFIFLKQPFAVVIHKHVVNTVIHKHVVNTMYILLLSSFPHLFPLLCGVDVSYETPPFSTVLRVLP